MPRIPRLSDKGLIAKEKQVVVREDLSPSEEQFCYLYLTYGGGSGLRSGNGTKAAIDAGYAPRNAGVTAHLLLRRPRVQAFIQQLRQELAERHSATLDEVTQHLWDVATSDVRLLLPVEVVCCRHCYGIDNLYQYTEPEMKLARREHMRNQLKKKDPKDRIDFDEKGGDGYDHRLQPKPDCPECKGEGIARHKPADYLDRLPAHLTQLIAGFNYSIKNGISIKFRDDRMKALEMFSLMMGYVKTRKVVEVIDPSEMTDEQIDTAIRKLDELERLHGAPIIEGESHRVETDEER